MDVVNLDKIRKKPIDYYEIANETHDDSIDYIKDAFMKNPVASANDCTGFVQRVPYNKYEAAALESLSDTPVSYDDDIKK